MLSGTTEREGDETALDGRVARGLRTRAAVIDALLGLVDEGDLRPTAPAVAARAGVSLRSVFGHFSDMDSLFLEAARRHAERILPLYEVPLPTGRLAERVPAFVARRAHIWECVTPVRRAVRLAAPQSPKLRELLGSARLVHRQEVTDVFSDVAMPAATLDAVDLILSWETWETLRGDRGLSVAAACEVVETAVGAILRDLREP